jgi:hypothetical protein
VAKLRATRKFYRVLEVVLLCLVSTAVPFWLSYARPECVPLADGDDIHDFNTQARAGCPPSPPTINLVNAIFFDQRDPCLTKLFALSVVQVSALSSALVCAAFFVGTFLSKTLNTKPQTLNPKH